MTAPLTTDPMDFCCDCGMPVKNGEYHPYAACLMFKACHDSRTVEANLEAVIKHGWDRCVDEGMSDE